MRAYIPLLKESCPRRDNIALFVYSTRVVSLTFAKVNHLMSTRSNAALKRSSTSQEPEASRKRPVGRRDGTPSNDSRGAQFQTACNRKSSKSGEGGKQSSLQNCPAKERSWSGMIEVDHRGMRLSEKMSAHPSAKVSRKAYEFSKNLNPELHFELIPRSEWYPRIFEDACPNRDDIALYFYPYRVDRPKGIYSKILKSMKNEKLMMRSCIDGIELLLFPSTILPADLQLVDGSYFIWGVFRREEDAKKKTLGLPPQEEGPPRRVKEHSRW